MDIRQAEYLKSLYARIQTREITWAKAAVEFNETFNESIEPEPLRNRVRRLKRRWDAGIPIKETSQAKTSGDLPPDVTKYNEDGSIEAKKVVELSRELLGNKDAMLDYLGYDHTVWEFVFIQSSIWEQKSNIHGLSNLYAIKYRVKQRECPTVEFFTKAAVEAFHNAGIPSYRGERTLCPTDIVRLMEIPPIELHLGKLSQMIETGEEYNYRIAEKRFWHIINTALVKQEHLRCNKCLLVIGSDFFNSESDGNTTTHKIPQNNDVLYKKMFITGLNLYCEAIKALARAFEYVDVRLCAGNHARAMEFFLYVSLKEHFKDTDGIEFGENYRDTQAYEFGKCAIFFNHGDANLKQTISSIPSEFPDVWGRTLFRELHLGHLHKEMTVDDSGGMITRRIGSPCGTDAWHYQNRFVGATKKHQVFVWNAMSGLEEIFYINNTAE